MNHGRSQPGCPALRLAPTPGGGGADQAGGPGCRPRTVYSAGLHGHHRRRDRRTGGVCKPTVFTAAGSKQAILKQLRDIALAGDDEPVPVAQRPWYREALAEPDPRRVLRLHARNATAIHRRSADVHEVLRAAAASDKDLHDLWRASEDERRGGAAIVVDALLHKSPLKAGLDCAAAIDIVWILTSSDIFWRLVHTRRWSDAAVPELARRHAVRTAPAASRTRVRVVTCSLAPGSTMGVRPDPRELYNLILTAASYGGHLPALPRSVPEALSNTHLHNDPICSPQLAIAEQRDGLQIGGYVCGWSRRLDHAP